MGSRLEGIRVYRDSFEGQRIPMFGTRLAGIELYRKGTGTRPNFGLLEADLGEMIDLCKRTFSLLKNKHNRKGKVKHD